MIKTAAILSAAGAVALTLGYLVATSGYNLQGYLVVGLAEADTRRDMGRAGLDRVNRQFSVQRMVDETEDLYRDLLSAA